MSLVCLIVLLCSITLLLVLHVKLYDPLLLFPVSFFILFTMEKLKLYGLFSPSSVSFEIITVGVICFMLGCSFIKMIEMHQRKISDKVNTSLISSNIAEIISILTIFSVIAIIIEVMYAIPSIQFLRSGGSFYDMRYSEQNVLQRSGILSFLHVYLAVPTFFIELPIAIYNFFIDNKKLLFFLNIICTFFYVIGNGARMPLIYVILSLLSVIIIFYPQLKKNGKLKHIIITLLSIIILISVISRIRASVSESSNITFIQGIYYYITSSMINFGSKIDFVSFHEPLFGIATLYGLFLPISNIINLPLVTYGEYLFESIQNSTVYISSVITKKYNFSVTGFLNMYADGGIVGIIAISILFGVTAELVFYYFKYKESLKGFVFESLILQAIMMYVITDMFGSISFVLALIYTSVFFNMNKHRNNIRVKKFENKNFKR